MAALAMRPLDARSAGARSTGAPQGESFEAVDAYLDQQLKGLNVPGASLAIVEGDRIVHTYSFGEARPGGEAPTPQTVFSLGSLTKSFTAVAVMQLVEAGQIELDAPVQRYLPWFSVADPQASAEITVRHLLNQTSGISQISGMRPLADFDDSPGAGERQARALSTLKLTRPVGSAFEYSNMNYNLLGLIVEAASGEPYADYVQRHIFDPLDMAHTYTDRAAAPQNSLATGHQSWFGVPIARPGLPMPAGSLPSGQLLASSEDVAHYLIAHLNAGRYADAQILSPEGVAELHRPVAQAVTMGADLGAYGMGWFVEETAQGSRISHSGTVPDFFAYMALLPEQNRGMVLLVNTNQIVINMALVEVGSGAATLLAGGQPGSAWPGAIPWGLRAALIIPILQVAGVAVTTRRLRRWRHDAGSRPGPARKWGLHVVLPAIPNLVLASGAVGLLVSGMFRFLMLFLPDLSTLVMLSGGFALAWLPVRTGMILSTLRKSPPARRFVQRPGMAR